MYIAHTLFVVAAAMMVLSQLCFFISDMCAGTPDKLLKGDHLQAPFKNTIIVYIFS